LNGPWPAWAAFCERLLDADPPDAVKSNALWLPANCRKSLGQPEAAEAKSNLENVRGADRNFALARGLAADILQARGELDEALRIYNTEVLPVYERLGDTRMLVVDRANLAIHCLKFIPPRRPEANHLLCQALADARRMGIPEAEIIQEILEDNDMTCDSE
jgi:hypothetical protein